MDDASKTSGIREAFAKVVKIKETKFSPEETSEIRHHCAKFIAGCNLPLSTFEKDSGKEFMEFVVQKLRGRPDDAKIFAPSRYLVKKAMENTSLQVKAKLKTNGYNLASVHFSLSIQVDHWHCTKLSSEMHKKYFGILLNVRDPENNLTSITLAFEPTGDSKGATTVEMIRKTLEVNLIIRFGVLKSC
jgi:hypothetical protein